jgi:hypothetical protein
MAYPLTPIPPIALDIDLISTAGDFTMGTNRDLQNVAGAALIAQRVALRLRAVRGTALWDATYGGDLAAYIGTPLTPAVQDQIAAAVQMQCLLEPLVLGTGQISATLSPDDTTLLIRGDLYISGSGTPIPFSAAVSA